MANIRDKSLDFAAIATAGGEHLRGHWKTGVPGLQFPELPYYAAIATSLSDEGPASFVNQLQGARSG